MTASNAFGRPLVSLAEVNQDKVTPGLLGFVIFAALAFGLWMLMKNMGKQMKKIDFEEQPAVEKPTRAAAVPAPASGDAKGEAGARRG
ncbi:hypothetical protein [Streptomyces sp. NPDC049040]|uniref:hypothetical protein n=1 Tax=Streptomyces sp. NPDC049040 TaxID=3365593 RepID=UPI003711FAC2